MSFFFRYFSDEYDCWSSTLHSLCSICFHGDVDSWFKCAVFRICRNAREVMSTWTMVREETWNCRATGDDIWRWRQTYTDVDAFEKRCPPGLWCGKKRAITEENAAAEKEKDESLSLEAFEKRCPSGLWCGKKRTIRLENDECTEKLTPDWKTQNSMKMLSEKLHSTLIGISSK